MKVIKNLLSIVLICAMIIPMCIVGVFAADPLTCDETVAANWTPLAAKYAKSTCQIIAPKSEGYEIRTKKFGFEKDENDGIKVHSATYMENTGVYSVAAVASKYKTAIDGLSIELTPDDLKMECDSNNASTNISFVISENPITEIATFNAGTKSYDNGLYNAVDVMSGGLRNLNVYEGKSLTITVYNQKLSNTDDHVATSVAIVYDDGNYINSNDGKTGFRWVFTARNSDGTATGDKSSITQTYENIDFSEGLKLEIRADEWLGYIVSLNGKDYYNSDHIAFFPDCSQATFEGKEYNSYALTEDDYYNFTKNYTDSMTYALKDIDLSGLGENFEGYLTVGATGTLITTNNCDFTVTKINSRNAATWQGEPVCRHTETEVVTTKEANCGYDGEIVTKCIACGKVLSKESVPATGEHTLAADYVITKAATCVTEGTKTKSCTECEKIIETVVIAVDPVAHEGVVVGRVDATCTADGTTGEVTCKYCGKILAKGQVIPMVPHTLIETEAKAATCTEIGWDEYVTCDACGYTTYEEIAALGHDKSVCLGIVSPLCEEDGYTIYMCSVCEEVYRTDIKYALGHTEGDVVRENVINAICLNDGSYDAVVYCTVCGEELSRDTIVVPALGHDLVWHEGKQGSCTEIGWNEYFTCERCDYTTYEDIPLGHYYKKNIIQECSCLEGGIYLMICDCGDYYIDYPEPIPHLFENYVNNDDYTCTEDGTKTAYCEYGCGTSDTVIAVGSAAHRYVEEIIRSATCTKTGIRMMICDCGDYYTENIAKLPHLYTDYVYNNDATCTEDGTKTAYCDYGCGNSETVTAVGTVTDHSYESVVTLKPTCTAYGTMTYTCRFCGTSYTEQIEKTGHNYIPDVVKEPTCTSTGIILYMCECRAYYTVVAPKAEHPFGEWEMITAPTDSAPGVEIRKCTVCGVEETRESDVLPKPEVSSNNYTLTITNATYIKDIRYVLGIYTTTTEIRNAEGNVALDNKVVKNNTVDGKFIYDLPDGGIYSLWVRMTDGRNYIFNVDMTSFTPVVSTYGVKISVDGLYDIKDCFIAKGEYNTYNEIKDNGYIVRLTANKIAGKHSYTYTVSEPGVHTVLVRYNDGSEYIFHEELVVDEPVFITNGLQVTVSNIPDVKVIRTAYGEYYTPGETKRAPGARNFSNKSVIKDAERYLLQYREEGIVTIIVEYNNGYVRIFHYDVTKKVPTVEQDGTTVIFGNLDGLVMIRYAEGEYETSAEIKRAPGSKVVRPDGIVDGKITISDLTDDEIYTFCVQYDDDSYYIFKNGVATKNMKINGNDITNYKIVYSKNEANKVDSVYDAAVDIQHYIEKATGVVLPVVTDDSSVSEYEILIGKTNREDEGIVSVNRNFDDDQTYCWSVQGNYLVITGIDSDDDYDNADVNVNGTQNAVFMFGREVLNVREYIDDELVVSNPGPHIELSDGYYYENTVWFRQRTFYMKGSVNACGTYKDIDSYCISMWLTGDYGNYDLYHNATPCLSDEDNINAVINNVSAYINKHPNLTRIGIEINDNSSYCKCSSCSAIYRQYAARSAPFTILVNRIAQLYPDIEFVLWAYDYCQKPPKDITIMDNVMVVLHTINCCSGHGYDSTECSLNKSFCENILAWNAISDGRFTISDCSGNFVYFLNPMPDWDSLLSNVRFFAENGAREILMNSVFYGEDLPNGLSPENHSDFGAVRAYMLSLLYIDPYMTEEEFNKELNGCLKAHYGEGWTYIREYLDIIAELGNDKCHFFHASPSAWYDFTKVNERADYIDSLWNHAIAEAEGDEVYNLNLAKASWDFLRQCATYEYRYNSGSDAQRVEYIARNEKLYNDILSMRLLWTEGTLNLLDNYSPTLAPSNW